MQARPLKEVEAAALVQGFATASSRAGGLHPQPAPVRSPRARGGQNVRQHLGSCQVHELEWPKNFILKLKLCFEERRLRHKRYLRMRVSLVHNPTAGSGQPTAVSLLSLLDDAGFSTRYLSSNSHVDNLGA